VTTTVGRMRTTLLILSCATLLVACGGGSGGSGDPGGSGKASSGVEDVRTVTTGQAQEAVPLVADALGATATKATAQWQSCMAISWRYEAFATITAPEGKVDAQLASVREALTGAGFEDTTQVDGHVTVTRDDTTVDVQPAPARGAGAWTVSVASSCADYDGDDLDQVENDEPHPLDGV
jgi:hypothetical protein